MVFSKILFYLLVFNENWPVLAFKTMQLSHSVQLFTMSQEIKKNHTFVPHSK